MSTTSEFIKKIRSLRDELTVEAFGRFGGSDREASMAIAKLDEAELWLIRRGLTAHSHILVDKGDYVALLEQSEDYKVGTLARTLPGNQTDATVATDTGEESPSV